MSNGSLDTQIAFQNPTSFVDDYLRRQQEAGFVPDSSVYYWDLRNMFPAVTTGGSAAIGGLPDAAAAFAKYQQIAPGTETPQPAQIIQDVLNNPVYSAEQKELILEGYRQNIGLDEDLFNVIRNSAMGTVYTQEELEDIFKNTTDSDIPKTPKELFQESTIEEKQEQIQSILDESPDATIDDILRVMQNWGISAELFKSATGYYPRGYVAQRDGTGGTGGEEGGDDDECQPGYEKWNGSCVAVCNAAAGYVRDEDPSSPTYGSCVLMDDGGNGKDNGGEDTGTEECKPGQVRDEDPSSPTYGACVPIKTGGDDGGDDGQGDNGKTCATGYVYDEALQKCVPIKKEVTGGGGDLNGPTDTTVTGLPQESTTEAGGVGGLFAMAASPTRTTDEVLAPDLAKIDLNIPLLGRLTQARPMAAPQYLLSGISQRFRV